MTVFDATSASHLGRLPALAGRPVRVMIVEDSKVVREVLTHAVSQDPRLEIAAVVGSGEEALAALEEVRPDVISMDIRLPGIDGLETIRRIMTQRPTPIIVVASDVQSEELKISINALRAGALAVLEKQACSTQESLGEFAGRFCTQLLIMSQVRVITQRASTPGRKADGREFRRAPARREAAEMVGIVASTGGPNALVHVLGALRADFPLPILLVQHITSAFSKAFIEWLGGVCDLRVVEARDGMTPAPGTVHVAPAEAHLIVRGRRLRLDHGAQVCSQRPSGTVMLASMARELGAGALGVVLTGMGEDGASGLREIRAAGGYTLAEHESTAVVYGMPAAADAMGAVCELLPLPSIGRRIHQLATVQGTALHG